MQIRVCGLVCFNESFGSVNAQRIAVPVEVANNGPGFAWLCFHFVGNFEIAGCSFCNIGANTPPETGFGLFGLVVGRVVTATLQHCRPVEQGKAKGSTEGNIFYAPKNGVLAKGCHGLSNKTFGH